MVITNLNTHSASYVTVAELAEYWEVTRQLVYKHIQSGLLPAIRLGPRCFRVRTEDAVAFERLLSSRAEKGNGGPNTAPRGLTMQLIRQKNRRSTSA
jgi:excisionase family DNA binding protein